MRVIKTSTREPLKWYSRLISGSSNAGIPQGEVNTTSFFGKCAAYIRGNFFIPDARKGWVPFAVKAAEKLLQEETIQHLITDGTTPFYPFGWFTVIQKIPIELVG